jgi:hypothetical protein
MPLATTVYVACPNGWTQISALYGSTVPNVAGWTISCRTQSVQWAVAETTPNIATGHAMTSGESISFGLGNVDNVWFKNEVSATVGYLNITPNTAY